MQKLKQGTTLDHGKYRIEKCLGSGGFGITYLAIDIGLNKYRAIKEFFPKDFCEREESSSRISLGTVNTAEFVERLKKKFVKEARNIANLDQHQGIVRIQTVFEENNTAYYVMDYIEGDNLDTIVMSNGKLPLNKALKYINRVGEALEYVHKHNINHLDVKPANIMIRRSDDSPILIDFGLSKQYDSKGGETSTTPIGISPGYSPIEQYNDGGVKEFTPETDVYSLAATLYYLISAQKPPKATDLTQNDLTFPKDFPEYLKAPIIKGMSTKKNDRHHSVTDFLNDINSRVAKDKTDSENITDRDHKEEIKKIKEEIPFSDRKKDDNETEIIQKTKSKPTEIKDKRKSKTKHYSVRQIKRYIWENKKLTVGISVLGVIFGVIILFWIFGPSVNTEDYVSSKNISEQDFTDNPDIEINKLIERESEPVWINGIPVQWAIGTTYEQDSQIEDLLNNMVLYQGIPEDSSQDFYIELTPVTVRLWTAIMEEEGDEVLQRIKNQNKSPYITEVNYYDCVKFINKLNELTNLKFTLPSSEELDLIEFQTEVKDSRIPSEYNQSFKRTNQFYEWTSTFMNSKDDRKYAVVKLFNPPRKSQITYTSPDKSHFDERDGLQPFSFRVVLPDSDVERRKEELGVYVVEVEDTLAVVEEEVGAAQ